MKIAVLGARGMLGHMLTKYLRIQHCEIITFGRQQCDVFFDVLDPTTHHALSDLSELDFVVNCIGLLVQESQKNFAQAILVNSWLPQHLASLLAQEKTRLIQVSTDCVFSGLRGAYKISDQPDETNSYGRTKALGEVNNSKDICFRTSIIGPEIKDGTGLFHWFCNKSPTTVNGYTNAFWNGLTTLELSKQIWAWCTDPQVTGIVQVCRSECFSKYEILCHINDIFGVGKTVIPTELHQRVDKTLVPSPELDIPPFDIQLLELYQHMQV